MKERDRPSSGIDEELLVYMNGVSRRLSGAGAGLAPLEEPDGKPDMPTISAPAEYPLLRRFEF